MSRGRSIRIAVMALVVALLAFKLALRFWPSEAMEADFVSTTPASEDESAILAQSDGRGDALDEVALPFSNSSIPDETIVGFDSFEELEAFLEAAKQEGLTVIAVERRLRFARVSVPTGEEASTLRRIAGEKVHFDENHTVLLPFPVSRVMPDYRGEPVAMNGLSLIHATDYAALEWGAGIKIAILDTGVLGHSSLSHLSIETVDLVGDNQADGDLAMASHGTAIASVIAGQFLNGIARSSELMSIRVLDSDGLGDVFTLAQGIVEAVDRGANIVNLSLGGFGSNQVLEAAVDYALANEVVLVAASGNEGLGTLPYPALLDGVYAISAVDGQNGFAPFSNQGERIAIAAPGVGVYAAGANDEWISVDGTSIAAPFFSAAVAAVASREGISVVEAAELIVQYAADIGNPGIDSESGAGAIDLERVFERSNPQYQDIALADIYLSKSESGDQKSVLYATAQNRGTHTVQGGYISVTASTGLSETVYLDPLEPGAVGSVRLEIENTSLHDEMLTLQAKVGHNLAISDLRPENDSKVVRVSVSAK